MTEIDMWDFRLYVRECLKLGQVDEIIKILTEENVIPQGNFDADKLKAEFDLIADKYGVGEKKYISIKDIKMIIDKTSTVANGNRNRKAMRNETDN